VKNLPAPGVSASRIAEAIEFGRYDRHARFAHLVLGRGKGYFSMRSLREYREGRREVLRWDICVLGCVCGEACA
jgi:hypothetical protein